MTLAGEQHGIDGGAGLDQRRDPYNLALYAHRGTGRHRRSLAPSGVLGEPLDILCQSLALRRRHDNIRAAQMTGIDYPHRLEDFSKFIGLVKGRYPGRLAEDVIQLYVGDQVSANISWVRAKSRLNVRGNSEPGQ